MSPPASFHQPNDATRVAAVLAVRVLLLSLALVAAACGGGGPEQAAPEPTQTRTSIQPAQPPGPSPAERFGYIQERLDRRAGRHARVRRSRVPHQGAQKAAEDDGAVEPGDAVPNDYYIRNPGQGDRRSAIANDAAITGSAANPAATDIPAARSFLRRSRRAGRRCPVPGYVRRTGSRSRTAKSSRRRAVRRSPPATSGRCRTSSPGSARSAPPRSRAPARAACRAGR